MAEEFEAGLGAIQDDHDRLMAHMDRRRKLLQTQTEDAAEINPHRANPEVDDCGNPVTMPHPTPNLNNDALDLIAARIKQIQEQNTE